MAVKILVACEYSGVVRDAFRLRGHLAISCDLLPTNTDGPHHQGDVREIFNDEWDLMIAHPPCTHLSVSGVRWFKNKKVEFHVSPPPWCSLHINKMTIIIKKRSLST